MALTLELSTNGGSSWNSDRTSELANGSLTISYAMGGRSTATFELVNPAGTASPPQAGQPIRATDGAGTPFVYFSGTIDTMVINIPTATDAVIWKITCVDHTQILDRRLVNQKWEDKTLAFMVTNILSGFVNTPATEGITYTAPSPDTTLEIDRAIFNYSTAAESIERLAILGGYNWRVGTDKVLTFQPRSEATSASSLTDGAGSIAIANTLSLTQTRQQYRNVQYVSGSYGYTVDQTDTWSGSLGDSASGFTEWTTTYPIGIVTSVEVKLSGGAYVAKTIGIQGVDDTQFLYQVNSNTLVSGSYGALPAGSYLRLVYNGLYPTTALIEDTDEISQRVAIEGGNGRYELMDKGAGLLGSEIINDFVSGLLLRYGVMPSSLMYQTDTAGLIPGTLQQTDLSRVKLLNQETGVAAAISDQYLIESVKAKDIGNGRLRYTVKTLSGDSVGGWEKFFTDLKNANQSTRFDETTRIDLTRNIGTATAPEIMALTDSVADATAARESRVGTALVAYSEAA